jgi:hypothetical protein
MKENGKKIKRDELKLCLLLLFKCIFFSGGEDLRMQTAFARRLLRIENAEALTPEHIYERSRLVFRLPHSRQSARF